MFWLLRKGFKLGVILLAVYGIAHLPVKGEPLWKAFTINQRIGKKKIKSLFREFKENLTHTFVIPGERSETRDPSKIKSPRPKEMFKASEEEKLKELLSER
ncbi:MAG: hypothetical protein A3B70_04465 [Deltaproteobacteria bacterium RIFCSPHIGHO2_02_FULL_40_11]|nr:MAG: hypothetical protein A3B70_04465 [Deltaproteobacteria bacterium RIFCSPHIGHO2_02_FULL_40_11]